MITFLKEINNKYKYNQGKLSSLYKNKIMRGGGELMDCINIKLIIGILLLIVSIIFIHINSPYNSTNANILKKNNNLMLIEYYVNDVRYEKILEKQTDEDIIEIYYEKLNPNLIRLYQINYTLIGIIILAIAIYLILI